MQARDGCDRAVYDSGLLIQFLGRKRTGKRGFMGFLAQTHEMQSVCLPENLVKLQLSQQQNYLVQKLERRKISQKISIPSLPKVHGSVMVGKLTYRDRRPRFTYTKVKAVYLYGVVVRIQ